MDFLQDSTSISLPNVIDSFANNTGRKQIMVLNLFVDHDDVALKNIYMNAAHKHNLSLIEDPQFCNSGFDLSICIWWKTGSDKRCQGANYPGQNRNAGQSAPLSGCPEPAGYSSGNLGTNP